MVSETSVIEQIGFGLKWEELIEHNLVERKQTQRSLQPTGNCSLMREPAN